MLLHAILKGKSVFPAVADEQGPLGQQTEPQNCAEVSAEAKASAVFGSEDRLMVVKFLSVPIVFIKMFCVSKNMSRNDFGFESLY